MTGSYLDKRRQTVCQALLDNYIQRLVGKLSCPPKLIV
jgi:hypothetical protein